MPKISELPVDTAAEAADQVPVLDAATSTTKRVTVAKLREGLATLGSDGKVPAGQLPTLTTSDAPRDPSKAVWKGLFSYLLENFDFYNFRWASTSGGSIAFANNALTVTTPASNDVIANRQMWSAIAQDFDTITFEVNFNGNTFITAGDTPILILEQAAGWKYILLHNFATQGLSTWQTVSVPLSKFTTVGDATTGTAGTGTHFDPAATVNSMKIRIYEDTAGKTLSIRNIVLSDSTQTIRQDYIQPNLFQQPKPGSAGFRFQSVDIMKVSKDNLRGQYTDSQMSNLMKAVKPLNPTHIAMSTPYDDPSAYPNPQPVAGYAARWAAAIRAEGYKVFWRQSPIEWEGLYDIAKNVTRAEGTAVGVLNGSETTSYLKQIYDYIIAHADQYQPGDILAPIPEPENGGIAGITDALPNQFATANDFRKWLRDAITVCNAALDLIGLRGQVHVGWFGCSGFVVFGNVDNPYGFLDARTVDAMTIIGMDHYPNPVSDITTGLASYEALYGHRPLAVTEWGTINEATNNDRLAAITTFTAALAAKPYLYGLNYWAVIGGSGNANENLLDWSTYGHVQGFDSLATAFTNGSPMVPANALVNDLREPINITGTPSAGQALVSTGPNSAAWKSPLLPRLGTVASSATPAINTDLVDYFSITALAVAITSMTSGLTGTPVEGQPLHIAITGTASRAITWGSKFESSTVTLPSTTSGTARLDVDLVYNAVSGKFRCVQVA